MDDLIRHFGNSNKELNTIRVIKTRDTASFNKDDQNNRYLVIPSLKRNKAAWDEHLNILRMYDIRDFCSHNLVETVKNSGALPSKQIRKKNVQA